MKLIFPLFVSITLFSSCKKEKAPDPNELRYVDMTDALTADIDEDGILDIQIYNVPETTYTGWGDTIPYTSLRIKSLNDSLKITYGGGLYELEYDQIVDMSLSWLTNYRLESYNPYQPAHYNTPYIGLKLRKDGQTLFGWIAQPNNIFTEYAMEVEQNGIGVVKTGKILKE